jgi:hypothetical protein
MKPKEYLIPVSNYFIDVLYLTLIKFMICYLQLLYTYLVEKEKAVPTGQQTVINPKNSGKKHLHDR